LNAALEESGALGPGDEIDWQSPLEADEFREYRDGEALRRLGIESLPSRDLNTFWPRRGPVWDALGRSKAGRLVLVEAKAHIPEAVSPPSKASEVSIGLIRQSLEKARRYYTKRSDADWSGVFYQYANRLAFQYLLNKLNGLPSVLVFLDFINARDVNGPTSSDEWRGATRVIHTQLGLPEDLRQFGVYHAYLDVKGLESLVDDESPDDSIIKSLGFKPVADWSLDSFGHATFNLPSRLQSVPGLILIEASLPLLVASTSHFGLRIGDFVHSRSGETQSARIHCKITDLLKKGRRVSMWILEGEAARGRRSEVISQLRPIWNRQRSRRNAPDELAGPRAPRGGGS
jgi:hypothetical protein